MTGIGSLTYALARVIHSLPVMRALSKQNYVNNISLTAILTFACYQVANRFVYLTSM